MLPDLAADRVVAVPFRHRATDAKGHFNDFSIHDLVTQPGSESWVNKDQATFTVPSRHRWSEAWALTHGKHTLRRVLVQPGEHGLQRSLDGRRRRGHVVAFRRRRDAAG